MKPPEIEGEFCPINQVSRKGIAAFALFVLGMIVLGFYDYYLFHDFSELFNAVVAFSLAAIVWNLRDKIDNGFILVISVVYAFMALFDIIHASVADNAAIPEEYRQNLMQQLSVSARYIQGVGLLLAVLLSRKVTSLKSVIISAVLLFLLLLLSILVWKIFPDCTDQYGNPTGFYSASKLVTAGLIAIALLMFWQKKPEFDPLVFKLIFASILLSGMHEFFKFIIPPNMANIGDIASHVTKVIAFYLLYKATIETGLTKPFSFMFFKLRETTNELTLAQERYVKAMEAADSGLYDWDIQNDLLYVSPRVEEIFGFPTSGLRSAKMWGTYILPEDRSRHRRAGMEYFKGNTPVLDCEYRIIDYHGNIRWIRERAVGTRDHKGRIVRLNGSVDDVTELVLARNQLKEANLNLEKRVEERTELLRQAHERLDGIMRTVADGIITFNKNGEIESFNPAAEIIFGYEQSEIIAQNVSRLMDLPSKERIAATVSEDLLCFMGTTREVIGITKTGRNIPLEIRVSELKLGETRIFTAILRDISERKIKEEALRLSEERYALAARGANDGLWDWNLKTGRVYYSPRWKAIVGVLDQEVADAPGDWFKRVHPEDADKLHAEIAAHLARRTPLVEMEYRILHKDGSYRWVLTRGLGVFDSNSHIPIRIAGSQSDITERKRAEQRLLHDAFHDALTGLPNRALFLDRLAHALSRIKIDSRHGFAVLFLNIDRFKMVNDTLGHDTGDMMIVALAKRLQAFQMPFGTLARLGGDEFALLVEDINETEAAITCAECLQAEISQPLSLGGQDIFPSASIGIVMGSPDYDRAEDILSDADLAMYRAKTSGKARHAIFERSLRTYSVNTLELDADLRRAIDRGEMVLYYQPIFGLEDETVIGFEALMRWRHPVRGLVAPTEFIPIAEDTGLIVPLGLWALEEACIQLSRWHKNLLIDRPLFMSVNVSSRQLIESDLIGQIGDILRRHEIKASSLKLEITESLLMRNPEIASDRLRRLKDLGVSLAIDDFGTGYSSLSYLHRYPFDTLKLDRSFIAAMREKSENFEIVRAIVNLAHALNMQVVAEGVEAREEVDLLYGLQCEFVQGYYFARPALGSDNERFFVAA